MKAPIYSSSAGCLLIVSRSVSVKAQLEGLSLMSSCPVRQTQKDWLFKRISNSPEAIKMAVMLIILFRQRN